MIYRYHGFSNWVIHRLPDEPPGQYTFGFELEVQRKRTCELSNDKMANKIIEACGDLFVFEHDGSIGDGFEIISHPMTWKYFNRNINIFIKLLKLLDENKYKSHDGGKCGLHVHVSRNHLPLDEQIYWITNINFILERFQTEIYKFSRRDYLEHPSNGSYCKSLTEKIRLDNGHESINKDRIKEIIKSDSRNDRYVNLNLCNQKTIEFRMFRGTLNWNTFFLSLNLINNIVNQALLRDNIIDWKSLVLHGLDGNQKEKCIQYCVKREIDMDEIVVIKLIDSAEKVVKRRTYKAKDLLLQLETE